MIKCPGYKVSMEISFFDGFNEVSNTYTFTNVRGFTMEETKEGYDFHLMIKDKEKLRVKDVKDKRKKRRK